MLKVNYLFSDSNKPCQVLIFPRSYKPRKNIPFLAPSLTETRLSRTVPRCAVAKGGTVLIASSVGAVVSVLASHQCGSDSITRTRVHMWVEFVVGSRPCSERFFFRYSGFPLFLKTNISNFQFDQESVPDLVFCAKYIDTSIK